MTDSGDLPPLPLPAGVTSRQVEGVNGLSVHILEGGVGANRPVLVLVHGYPELAFSWRKMMPLLVAAGWHVIAPDLRGFGRTIGWNRDYDGDLAPFRMVSMATDLVALVHALGLTSVAGVIGHDLGSPVAATAALIRPDIFQSLVLMSAPFAGVPARADGPSPPDRAMALDAALAALDPPRRHYALANSMPGAEADMLDCPQGLHAFMRAYFHSKSGDNSANVPEPLAAPAPAEFARLPRYYVLDRDKGMAETVAADMPDAVTIAACDWLTDDDLAVYVREYARSGFQGGLNFYRCWTDPRFASDMRLFAGRKISVPTCFIGGSRDWGIQQTPGALNAMPRACSDYRGTYLVPGAGHWVTQEAPEAVTALVVDFLKGCAPPKAL